MSLSNREAVVESV